MKNKRILGVLILILSIAGIYQYKKFHTPPEIQFSDLLLKRLDGSSFSFRSLSGKHLVIQFFATWCADCRRELPDLVKHVAYLESKNIKILLLSDESVTTLKSFQERYSLPIEILILPGSFKENGVYTLPTAYLICSNGSIVYQKTGALNWSQQFIDEQFDRCN